MNVQSKFIVPIAFAVATAFAPAVSHAQRVTMTVTGITAGGYDRIGLFGEPEHDIAAGLPYTLSISTDVSKLTDTRGDHWRNVSSSYGALDVSGYVTLAGTTYSWNFDRSRWVSVELDNYLNRLGITADGTNGKDGWSVSVVNHIGIDQPRGGWVKSLELDNDMAFRDYGSDGTTYSQFSVTIPGYPPPPDAWYGWSMSTTFFSKKHETMVWTVSPVPEPGQYAMLLLGGAALAGLRRIARRPS